MPAEKIHDPGLPGDTDHPHVRISWARDYGDIQVATLFDSKHGADVIITIVNDWLKAAGLDQIPGREELQKLIDEKANPDDLVRQFGIGFDGFHVTLTDRRNVNRAIKVLKNARDDSMGRDE